MSVCIIINTCFWRRESAHFIAIWTLNETLQLPFQSHEAASGDKCGQY